MGQDRVAEHDDQGDCESPDDNLGLIDVIVEQDIPADLVFSEEGEVSEDTEDRIDEEAYRQRSHRDVLDPATGGQLEAGDDRKDVHVAGEG